ncbi:MAG: sugar MFS transporter [Saprospiraceae bacterium]
MKKTNTNTAFAFLVTLFFMWAFLTAMNDILIPFVKELFSFGYTEAALVQFCFFGAFALMAIPASKVLEKVGYKNGIVIGLCIMGIGALLFYPASKAVYYPLFLGALFVLATGVTMLQVAANPYVAVLGSPETAASRLNLAQGFNSIAKILAPLFGSYFILAGMQDLPTEQQAEAVQVPYIGLGIALFLLASVFWFLKLPDMKDLDGMQEEAIVNTNKKSIWEFPHLLLGALAIFMYVGAEVSVASFLTSLLGEDYIAGLKPEDAGRYLSFYWGGLMVGRFLGAAILQKIKSQNLLAIMAVSAMVLLVIGILSTGWVAAWCIILVGFCNAIMWSNIFTLSIDGLGKFTSQGSGLLVTAIVGGAILPLLQGFLADKIGLQLSYIVPVFAFGYILYYALRGYKMGKVS